MCSPVSFLACCRGWASYFMLLHSDHFSSLSHLGQLVVEPLPSSLSGGNLSILKKRWEQQQSSNHRAPPRNPTVTRSVSSSSPLPKPAPPSLIQTQTKILRAAESSLDHDTVLEARVHSETRTNQLTEEPEDMMEMEAKHSKDLEGEGAAAVEVSDIEKPSVPINSLKMMFERGENPDNVSLHPVLLMY
ncbi:hypothetical protein GOODEAATRI_009617 [Goodea atripinnis]|uniref:Uncharacterized protein n=1 Tax=Goodea atripinnis TaxID=208336 RepID=A0ABV0MGE2_9TELE